MTPEQKQKVLKVFSDSQFGVIATNSLAGTPESAVVAVSNTSDLEIVIGSFKETRKNKNIALNPNVSLVIGWENSTTVQMEGFAEVIEQGEERIKLEDEHCRKNESSGKYRKDPRQEYIKVKPKWIRYSNFSLNPQEVWEVDL